ncbi:hypothetical protein [Wukongibacter sp. M2B1]|uniref:hypothetical protein n=1 Tax=Wukongibacter sp. M2B1 TaxID=3088895 RepID=UPI003D7BED2F
MKGSFKLLDIFKSHIKELENKEKYRKVDLLNEKFLIASRGEVAIYYSSHNEIINEGAEILIVGICPGWRQMEMAIRVTRELLNMKLDDDEISKRIKLKTRLFGTTRKNLIYMLNRLELHKVLGLKSSDELFDGYHRDLHTTSLIRYPVFINGNNYNGNSPSLLKNQFLFNIASKSIKSEINALSKVRLILPLGKAVERFLCRIYKDDENIYTKIIKGFPHPSGLNGHRIKFFNQNFYDLKSQFADRLKVSDH